MNIEESTYWEDQVIKYLNGELTTSEMIVLQKERETNKLVNDLYVLNERLYKGIQSVGRNELQERLKQIDEKLPPVQKVNNKRMTWIRLGMAAALVLIATFWFLSPNKEPNNIELFDTYFKPFVVISNGATRGDTISSNTLDEAIKVYSNSDYQNAIGLFSAAISSPNQDENMYLAVCHLALDQTQPAIDILSAYLKSNGSFENDARWYLALSFLKQNQLQKAIEWLNTVLDNPGAGIKPTKLKETLK